MSVDDLLHRALAKHQQGTLTDAEALYRQALAHDPRHVEALHLLALLLHQTNRNSDAKALLDLAIELDPQTPELHNVLGLTRFAMNRPDEALASFRRAIEIDPFFADALTNLSGALFTTGRWDEAKKVLQGAIAASPTDAEVHFLLGRLLHSRGEFVEAMESLRRAVSFNTQHAGALMHLGLCGIAVRDFYSAGQAFLILTNLHPNDAQAHFHLALTYDRLSDADAAARHYLRAIELKPDYVEAHNNLGVILHHQRRMGDAIRHHKHAMQIRPTHAAAQANLGWDYWALGLVDDAIACYRKSLELDPSDYLTHSNLLMALHYVERYTPEQILEEHLHWAKQHAAKFYPASGARTVKPESPPARRLRLGYVSGNFREHPVSIFFEPIIRNHDRTQFEIFCYSDVLVPDAVTERTKSHADHWHETRQLTDEQLDAMIRSHDLDILVDLTGHTADNRLMVFARRPASIQVTYLGYPDTTGLATMDYRLTDALQDPPGSEKLAAEKLVRLPNSAWTYDPWAELPVGDPPHALDGFITFGSFNNLAKISPQMLEAWADILHGVPKSRLALLIQSDRFAEDYFIETLGKLGIPHERLVFQTTKPHLEYLKLFSTLDIALDTFPYNGHTTTLNASWMGVPVITLAGANHVARAGLGVLSTIGVPELVAHDKSTYKHLAISLARHPDRLMEYRRSLRGKIKASPLCDSRQFTRNLEGLFRGMWTHDAGVE